MKLSPSIMCANLMNVARDVRDLERGGATSIHVDIMDGQLVPGFTFGADFVRELAGLTGLPLDVHLMSKNPVHHLDQFLSLPIDSLTIHAEADGDVFGSLLHIRSRGKKAGIALNPGTSLSSIDELLTALDIVLVMAVSPGFVGQKQSSHCVSKAAKLVHLLQEQHRNAIEVVIDGGVKLDNVGSLAAAGVHRVVSGTGIFRKDMPPHEALARFHERILSEPIPLSREGGAADYALAAGPRSQSAN